MRLLQVCPRVPFPPIFGSTVRVHNLASALANRHEVRQFAQAGLRFNRAGRLDTREWENPPYERRIHNHPIARVLTELSEQSWVNAPLLSGEALRLTRPASLRRLLRWADATIVEFPWQLGFCAAQPRTGPLVLDAHNVEAVKFRSWARAIGTSTRRSCWVRYVDRTESAAIRTADLVLAVSVEERLELVRRHRIEPGRVAVVPNGADTDRYAPVSPDERRRQRYALALPDRLTVAFVASDAPPNRPGLAHVRRLARELPAITFLAIGSVTERGRDGNFVSTGLVSDTRQYLAASDFAVCPIEYGAGTKIKLWETLSCGLPTVAFENCVSGGLQHRVHLLAVPAATGALRDSLEQLTQDPSLALRLARAGRDHVIAHHDWRRSAERLEAALERLLSD